MSGELDRTRAEIVAAGREAIADVRRAADEAAAAIVRTIEAETGETIAAPVAPSVMDASRDQLAEADLRAQRAVAAMDQVLRRWSWGDARTLGELMPTLPEDVREQIADHLVRAGLS
ncbi:hypothetical protein ACIQAC_37525 [Streptomyces sp. NPDC088387]|uniref:hypothetical protein n=1 Tax=Streptomyces sp. NPDC088387 TaxID=3365859 RepID=UPI0038038BB6